MYCFFYCFLCDLPSFTHTLTYIITHNLTFTHTALTHILTYTVWCVSPYAYQRMDCYDYNRHVFYNNEIHNNESTPTDISTLWTTLSSLGISIAMILCYSSYFGLTKSNYFCFSLAFGISFHYQFWWMDLGAFI